MAQGPVEHETRFAGRSIQQIYRCEFYNQSEELVAEAIAGASGLSAITARERGTKYEEVKKKAPVHYDREDLAKIFSYYESEEIRVRFPALSKT